MVRLFPRTLRRQAIATLAVFGLLLGVAALPLASAEDLKDKKHQVEKDLKDQRGDVDESSAELQAATAALLRARADLATAQAYLAKTRGQLAAARVLDRQMQAKLELAIARLQRARADLAAGLIQVAEQEDLLGAIVVENYQSGDAALMGLSAVFTSQDPAQLTGQLNSASTVLDKESVILDRLEVTKVLLTVKEAEIEAAKIEVAKKRKDAAENLVRMKALELQATQAEEQVRGLVDLRAQAKRVAMQAKHSELKKLKQLEQERDRIEQLIKQQASHGKGYTGPSTGNGFLDYPVPGVITSPYGWRTHPIYGYRSLHDGIDFGAGCGTPIRASAGGKVLQEYYQTAWGNRLIMDHGVHYGVGVATIYNHLSGYAVAAGESVKRGQVIGYVGTTGWSTGCHLHYTVLENGVAVDPLKWL